MQKIVLNWSSGKDAALALHCLRQQGEYEPAGLLTTLSAAYDRVSMHGTREVLLDMQATAAGLPLHKIRLPEDAGMETYGGLMQAATRAIQEQGIGHMAFGDIFLEDLRRYREQQLAAVGMNAVFPLWKRDTASLVCDIEDSGIKAMIVCVNDRYLGKEFLGKMVGRELLQALPKQVDPCGEHGEFHTLVIDAPYFTSPLAVHSGEIVYREYKNDKGEWDQGFYYLDVLPDRLS